MISATSLLKYSPIRKDWLRFCRELPKILSIKNLRPEIKEFSDDFWMLRVPKG